MTLPFVGSSRTEPSGSPSRLDIYLELETMMEVIRQIILYLMVYQVIVTDAAAIKERHFMNVA